MQPKARPSSQPCPVAFRCAAATRDSRDVVSWITNSSEEPTRSPETLNSRVVLLVCLRTSFHPASIELIPFSCYSDHHLLWSTRAVIRTVRRGPGSKEEDADVSRGALAVLRGVNPRAQLRQNDSTYNVRQMRHMEANRGSRVGRIERVWKHERTQRKRTAMRFVCVQ